MEKFTADNLPDEALVAAFDAAHRVYMGLRGKNDYKGVAASLRASLPAYAPPPRKIEVTPEIVAEFERVWCATYRQKIESGSFEGRNYDDLAGLRAAFAAANKQAEARESDDANDLRAYRASLVVERDRVERLTEELRELRLAEIEARAFERQFRELEAHAAKLEAMLTVEGEEGPVKLWLPFQLENNQRGWDDATLALCARVPRDSPVVISPRVTRQTPAPGLEVKHWWVRLPATGATQDLAWKYVTTDPMTRAEAEEIGDVIGEA